jgi:thymidylate synthase (FAD)
MKHVEPNVFLISRPAVDYSELRWAIEEMAGPEAAGAQADRWYSDGYDIGGQDLIEAGGRLCYKSWTPGSNKNVTRIREDQGEYLTNILKSGHGSVLEHANYTFLFTNVSRVFTHELVRHRAGSAFSQESLRFVRLDDIPFDMGDALEGDIKDEAEEVLRRLDRFQVRLAEHFDLDAEGKPFHEKKEATSFMRRFAPEGLATHIMWTANVRTLRHVIEARTAAGAEREMRAVFLMVGNMMIAEAPDLFGDFSNINGAFIPRWSKV